VALDGLGLRRIQAREGDASVRAVLMHELGHVVGLAHVDDRHELMYPKGSSHLTTWGPGDRAGLAALGSGDCVDD
jgi:predicted Zn-dependent protease